MTVIVPRLWPESTVVCIGGGPSLTEADVDACRGRARVIAVNDAYRLAPWADLLYACDGRWWKMHKGVMSFAGPKFALTAPQPNDWGVLNLRNNGRDGLCLEPDGLCTGRNSGYQAINLAVHLGAKRILLLGYDMKRSGGKSHWFGEHQRGALTSPYQRFLEAFTTMQEPLRTLGVEVINCTRSTVLHTFPKMTIDDALVSQMAGIV